MHKTYMTPINVFWVLDVFIGQPLKAMSVFDLLYIRGLREKTNEKMVRKAIEYLEKKRILKKSPHWSSAKEDEWFRKTQEGDIL